MPSFQARHYVAVARILHKRWKEAEDILDRPELNTVTRIGDDFMRMFSQDNPRFDSVRFYDAIKYGKGI